MRADLTRTSLGQALVIWTFGYALADVISFLIGRTALGTSFLASIPMLILGICLTEAIEAAVTGMRRRHLLLRVPVLIGTILLATAIQTLFDVFWLRYLALSVFPTWQQWAVQINAQRLLTVGILYLWTFCLSMTLLWAARASRASDVNAARAAEAEAAAAKAESAALRLQLNPHFLFNTMNSISSLVAVNRGDEAQEMIERLCDFLRASLHADPMEDVPLSQEIDAIDAYLSIEATRFGDRLHIDIDVAGEVAEAPVPNFILQPLVENAIKHGVSSVKGQSSLLIAAAREGEELVLTVINEAAEKDPGSAAVRIGGTGIGLSNSRQRLSNRYGERGRLVTEPLERGYRAQVRLPLAT